MTQEQVDEAMGTTQAVVARLESGRTMPSTGASSASRRRRIRACGSASNRKSREMAIVRLRRVFLDRVFRPGPAVAALCDVTRKSGDDDASREGRLVDDWRGGAGAIKCSVTGARNPDFLGVGSGADSTMTIPASRRSKVARSAGWEAAKCAHAPRCILQALRPRRLYADRSGDPRQFARVRHALRIVARRVGRFELGRLVVA